MRELADAGLVAGPAVVWLDDLERFLGPNGVDLGLLQVLCPDERSGIVVVATMRDEVLAHYDHATTASRADLR